jgi:hypothetical protein
MQRILACLLAASALSGCASDPKGDEDDLPIEGKDDSFFQPTSHGDLTFGIPGRASVTANEGFHSWTFTLTDNATVNVTTSELTGNLDTVMYVYKRRTTGAWGEFVYKNDDASDTTSASTLRMAVGMGQYRVVVKGYKRVQRGDFLLGGTCDGAGCPTQAACDPPRTLPADTGYGGACGNTLAKIFAQAPVDTIQTTTVAIENRCTAPLLQRAAIDYYLSYFGELEVTELEVETKVLGGSSANGGTLIDVTDGGDESRISFLFDHDNNLVALYLHNQSPDIQFFCLPAGSGTHYLAHLEVCMASLFGDVLHARADETAVTLRAASNAFPIGLDTSLRKAMGRYAQRRSLAPTTQMNAVGATWDANAGKVARVTVSAAGRPSTWLLADSQRVIIEAPSDSVAHLVCR